MADGDDGPKIIVDDDWKAQAQAEREKLAAEESQQAESGVGASAAGQQLPPADFTTVLGMLATQAVMYLGGMPDREGRAMVDLEVAQHFIGLLEVLEEKTRGNLEDKEKTDLEQTLHELRMRYVEISKMVAEQMAKQGGGGGAPDAGAGGGPGIVMP
ncbi:MAG: DUF1844 domain-containing protein [Planctomycetota bacterium]